MNEQWDAARYCRHPDCDDTNWGGRGRVHLRTEGACPPDRSGIYLAWESRDGPLPYTINEEEHPSEFI